MTLYKRGSTYWSSITINGIRHLRTTKTGNKRIAESIERKFEDELVMRSFGMTNVQPEMTFTELTARFLAEGDVKAYHRERLKVLIPFFGHLQLRAITRATVRDYRQYRMKGKKLTETTISRDLEVVRRILFWAVEEGLLAGNPLTRLKLAHARKRNRPILSHDEECALYASASPHLARITLCALHTGMRRGEILAQDWKDVDLVRGVLSVTHSKTEQGEQREIPLTSILRGTLALCQQKSGLIFTFHDQPINRIKTGWKAALRRSGIRPLRFHDLRHTFNTRLLDLGVVVDVRKALMGHSLGDDPHALYTHVEMPAKREAIAKLDNWLLEQAKQNRKEDGFRSDTGQHNE